MWFPPIKPITEKRLKQLARNHSSAEYQEWRKSVLDRDENRCQYPNCNSVGKCDVHHIKRWADAQHLRKERFNGIALCEKHHQLVTGSEVMYEELFLKITIAREKALKEKKDVEAESNRGHPRAKTTDLGTEKPKG